MAHKEKPADAMWAFLIDPHLKIRLLGNLGKMKTSAQGTCDFSPLPLPTLHLSFSPNISPPLSPCHHLLSLWWPLYVADLDRNGSVRLKHPARNNISHQIKKKRKESICIVVKCRTWWKCREGEVSTEGWDIHAISLFTDSINAILMFDHSISALCNMNCRSCSKYPN